MEREPACEETGDTQPAKDTMMDSGSQADGCDEARRGKGSGENGEVLKFFPMASAAERSAGSEASGSKMKSVSEEALVWQLWQVIRVA